MVVWLGAFRSRLIEQLPRLGRFVFSSWGYQSHPRKANLTGPFLSTHPRGDLMTMAGPRTATEPARAALLPRSLMSLYSTPVSWRHMSQSLNLHRMPLLASLYCKRCSRITIHGSKTTTFGVITMSPPRPLSSLVFFIIIFSLFLFTLPNMTNAVQIPRLTTLPLPFLSLLVRPRHLRIVVYEPHSPPVSSRDTTRRMKVPFHGATAIPVRRACHLLSYNILIP